MIKIYNARSLYIHGNLDNECQRMMYSTSSDISIWSAIPNIGCVKIYSTPARGGGGGCVWLFIQDWMKSLCVQPIFLLFHFVSFYSVFCIFFSILVLGMEKFPCDYLMLSYHITCNVGQRFGLVLGKVSKVRWIEISVLDRYLSFSWNHPGILCLDSYLKPRWNHHQTPCLDIFG